MKSVMKVLLILGLVINPILIWGQNDSINQPQKPSAMLGVDVFSPVYSIFTDKNSYEAMFSYPITQKIHLVAEAGYEQNIYDQNNWEVDVAGPFIRLGAQYFISQDTENLNTGYYIGARVAYSPFQQTVDSFIILDQNFPDENSFGSLPAHDASAVWLEPLAGGRVQIRESDFYIDASVRLKINIYDSNDYEINPLIIPGYGQNQNGLGLGFNWTLGYQLPF